MVDMHKKSVVYTGCVSDSIIQYIASTLYDKEIYNSFRNASFDNQY